MNRQVLIISNPGETGEENYCGGVAKDVENYRAFFLNPIGGLWKESEILEMDRPAVAQVRLKIEDLQFRDYVLVIFVGHGWHSEERDSTILTLRKGQEIDSAELRLPATKQTIILDCCRVRHPGVPEDRALLEMLAKRQPSLNPENCRRYYNEAIERCGDELVVTYGCGIGQRAADDSQKGGVYSYNLLDASKAWSRNQT